MAIKAKRPSIECSDCAGTGWGRIEVCGPCRGYGRRPKTEAEAEAERRTTMAAITFKTVGRGRNPRDAFRAAQEAARAEHGSFGYTGTIAEKPDFWMRTPSAPELTAFVERARRQGGKDLGRDDIRRQALFAFVDSIIMTNETWVPCFCVELGAGEYLFFGRASC